MTGSEKHEAITYKQAGVDYGDLDPFKIKAQEAAASTADNLSVHGYTEVAASRGESAFVWDKVDRYGALVIEGLGTKNLIADAAREVSGKTHYDVIARDAVAAIINDLITVGAAPEVIGAHFSSGESNWFQDEERVDDLLKGWVTACDEAGVTWGGGETPTLKGIVQPGVIEVSGSAVGEVKPKENLVLGNKLHPGDAIFLLDSNGISANGATLAAEIANRLPDGYATLLEDDSPYWKGLLQATDIYADVVAALQCAGVDIHYMVNITGHGWTKLMRANRELTYIIEDVPEPQPVFKLIQEQSGMSDEAIYSTLNMGSDFAIFVGEEQTDLAQAVISQMRPDRSHLAGRVVDGPKQLIIEPKELRYAGASLRLRAES